ncbi:MAG: single-stranded DNA-binding protein, partial [Opitutales bacterium]|nr:single-stranded DNA-binding protein [Opitutales bacterium]
MPNFNKVFLMGNLTRDPELRATPSGTAVCQFGLAVNRVYNNSNGERQEETTFVDVEAWGRQAETVSKYVSKGHPLFVEGRLKLDSWENKEGEKRSKMKVVLENMQLI